MYLISKHTFFSISLMCNLTCFSAFVLKIILGMIFSFMMQVKQINTLLQKLIKVILLFCPANNAQRGRNILFIGCVLISLIRYA